MPILDCKDFTSTAGNYGGLDITNCRYLKLRGLTVRNVYQNIEEQYIVGIGVYEAEGGAVWLDRMTVHNAGGYGFQFGSFDTLYVTNCDSYLNADSISPIRGIGNASDGFTMGSGGAIADTHKVIYYTGCRAWLNSDDGFDGSCRQFQYSNCWSFLNGFFEGGAGTGFKTSSSAGVKIASKRRISNCIAAFTGNRANETGSGFADVNLNDVYWGPVVQYYNNTAYKNVGQGFSASNGVYDCDNGYANVDYKNNLVFYGDGHIQNDYQVYLTTCHSYGAPYTPDYATYSNNSWIYKETTPYSKKNPAFTITNEDFQLLDSTLAVAELMAPRKADGSLPDLTFLKLASSSDLIDGGVDVGLPYLGTAPDLGYSEYDDTDTTALTVFTTSAYPSINYALIGVNVYDDGGDPITSRGVCWGTSANPTIANDTTINGSGTGTFIARIDPLLTNTTYHARAYAINQWGTGYGEDLEFTTLTAATKMPLYHKGKPVYHNGNPVWIGAGQLDTTILVTSINVMGTGAATTIEVADGTLQMLAEVLPANATNKTVTWSVINRTGTASISTSGLLSAVTDGVVTAKATAKDGTAIYDTLQITISNQSLVTSINVTGAGGATTISIDNGTLQMYVNVEPDIASDTTVTWSRINGTGTATISSTGLLTALTNGTVTVRATANDGGGIYDETIITLSNQVAATQIIADHTIVDRYDDIPAEYITEVKKMWVSYAGESHSEGVRVGLNALEVLDADYAVNITSSGTPEAYATSYLRFSRATWGDVNNATGWIYDYGEQDWGVTVALGTTRTQASLQYCYDNGPQLYAFGFSWCWDYGTNGTLLGQMYCDTTNSHIEYCSANSIPTKIFYTTGPVDYYNTGEQGYQQYLKYEVIRNYVLADADRMLFDFADILCYDGDGSTNTTTWNGHTYPIITSTNLTPTETYHISQAGALRLAKAMWWMLARMAGWDGN
jgi:hypothetical protein